MVLEWEFKILPFFHNSRSFFHLGKKKKKRSKSEELFACVATFPLYAQPCRTAAGGPLEPQTLLCFVLLAFVFWFLNLNAF